MLTEPAPRRALVTGGAGFIGSHLTRRLLADGIEVVVLDNLSTGRRENLPEGAELVVGDLRDASALEQALRGVEVVFHNAARVSIRASIENFREDAETNVMGTLALLHAMHGSTVRKLVLASSMAVYQDAPEPVPIAEDFPALPLSPYGTGKLAAEHYALQMGRALGIGVVPLRYFNTYGPGQGYTPYVGVVTIFATRLLRGERPVIFGDGLQVRDFVSVADIVQGNLRAMATRATGRVYNIGSGRGITVRHVAAALVARIAPGLVPDHAPAQSGETRNSIADISRARAELGYAPSGDFDRDLDDVVAAVRARLGQ